MAKVAGRLVKLKIGDTPSELPAFDFGTSKSADQLDVSDSSSENHREYITGYVQEEISFAYWFRDDATPPDVGDSVKSELHIGSKQFDGTFVVTNRNFSAKREDAARYDYTGMFTGALVPHV